MGTKKEKKTGWEIVFVYKMREYLDNEINSLWLSGIITTQQKRTERGKMKRGNWYIAETLNFLHNRVSSDYYDEIKSHIQKLYKKYYNDRRFINFCGICLRKLTADDFICNIKEV